ncbi:hypothetical protein D3C83_57080 [compost metagenome]
MGCAGTGSGRHRSWLGVGGTSLNGPVRMSPLSTCRNGLCMVEGRMRYVQVERLVPRGAVNDVPFSSST